MSQRLFHINAEVRPVTDVVLDPAEVAGAAVCCLVPGGSPDDALAALCARLEVDGLELVETEWCVDFDSTEWCNIGEPSENELAEAARSTGTTNTARSTLGATTRRMRDSTLSRGGIEPRVETERNAMVTPLNRVIIFVGDVQKCARFYTDVFGFTALPSDHASTEWIELDTGGCRLAFHKARGPDGPIDSPTGSPMNPHKIVFFAEDVAAARAAVVARGAVMGDVRKFGPLVLCDGKDPEGHVFQISNRA